MNPGDRHVVDTSNFKGLVDAFPRPEAYSCARILFIRLARKNGLPNINEITLLPKNKSSQLSVILGTRFAVAVLSSYLVACLEAQLFR